MKIRRFIRVLALLGVLMPALGFAQPSLANLVPGDPAVVVTFASLGTPFADIRSDLAELDWDGVKRTVEKLVELSADSDLASLSTLLGGETGLMDSLSDACPELEQPLRELSEGRLVPPVEGLLALEVQGIAPSVTALIRFDSASTPILSGLEAALSACAFSVSSAAAATGPVELYELDGEGMAVATLTEEGLLVVASETELVMEALERSVQPGETPAIFSSLASFEQSDTRFGFAIRPAAFIDALGLFVGASDSDLALFERISAVLSTIQSISGQWSAGGAATVSEWAIAVDPNGPDQELANLLLCRNCRAGTPFLVPAGAMTVSTSRFPVKEIFDYLQTWVALAEEPLDPQAWLESELGIDIEGDLFDWIGTEVHMAVLGPVDTDLVTLLYGPGQLFLIPVTSQQDATAGIERIAQVLEEELALGAATEFPVAVRRMEYRGFEYDRLQTSVNLDLGIGVIGNHLVLAFPSTAIEAVIDTFEGGPAAVTQQNYRQALEVAPAEAQAVWLQEGAEQLEGFADLLRLFAQPIAFGVQVALMESEAEDESELSSLWPVDLGQAQAQSLVLNFPAISLQGELDPNAGDPLVENELSDLYRLEGLEAGDEVTVVLESTAFDTVLSLIDAGQGQVVAYNDDAPDTSRSELAFTYEDGRDLLVQVTSFAGSSPGAYSLTVNVAGATPEPQAEVDPLTFTDLLELTELPSEVLDVLAEHVGTTVGYTVTEENVIYTRSTTQLAR